MRGVYLRKRPRPTAASPTQPASNSSNIEGSGANVCRRTPGTTLRKKFYVSIRSTLEHVYRGTISRRKLRMYQLYWAKSSGAMVPQALFEELGIEYEKIVIDFDEDEHRSEEFLAVNPMGQIPALVLPDGTLMTESAAMLLEIVERHPDAGLAPLPTSRERAHFLRWLFFLSSTVYPAILRFYYSDRHTTNADGAEGVKAAAEADLDHQFAVLEDALDPGPYLLGETFSAVDIFLWMLIEWHPDPARLFEAAPRLQQLAELVRARPAIARIWPEHKED
jgi:glutathione S-transferase